MHRFLTILAVAVLLLPVQAMPAAQADESEASEMTAEELSMDVLKVNINTDDVTDLAAGLKGVGLKRAEAIVRYREANGPFRDASELSEVKGIGERTVAANASRIEVDGPGDN